MPSFVDLTGQRFARLTVLSVAARTKRGKPRWRCRCDCGGETTTAGDNLKCGNTQSCGCLQRERTAAANLIHGHHRRASTTPTYVSWKGMMQRCYDPGCKEFHYWGGRGIQVCPAWHNFQCFLADMGTQPPKLTLDRWPDRDGNYEPGNCRWATRREQALNRRPRGIN